MRRILRRIFHFHTWECIRTMSGKDTGSLKYFGETVEIHKCNGCGDMRMIRFDSEGVQITVKPVKWL